MVENIKDLLWFIERRNIEPDEQLIEQFSLKYCLDQKLLNLHGKAVIDGPYNGNGIDLLMAKMKLKPVKKWRDFVDLLGKRYPKGAKFDYDALDMVKRSSTAKFLGVNYVILHEDDRFIYNRIYNELRSYEDKFAL